MALKNKRLVLSELQAACLNALRSRELSKSEIAIKANLNLVTTARELDKLARLGLARKDQTHKWHITAQGKDRRFQIVPTRTRRNSDLLGPSARRLLDLLDRPMRRSEIAEELGVTPQRVHQLVVGLHAQGHVRFADSKNPSWIVIKTGDRTDFLSHDEERVLSAIPQDYETDAAKIGLAARMSTGRVTRILQRLISDSLIKVLDGLNGKRMYRITAAGLEHPQRLHDRRIAQAPRLPVKSDRVRNVLTAIQDSGSLRIRDLTDLLRIPNQSLNALVQYLKRKQLVEKTSDDLLAPYSLTDKGRATLMEMVRRAA